MCLIEFLSFCFVNVLESGIVEVFNYGCGCEGLILFWVGEGDSLMLDFISWVVVDVFVVGEIFYMYQCGILDLCQVFVNYYVCYFGMFLIQENFIVMVFGMYVIKIVVEMIVVFGDEMIYFMFFWLNIFVVFEVFGVIVKLLELEFVGGVWKFDFNKLESVIGLKICGIFINMFFNLIGWIVMFDDLCVIFDIVWCKCFWIMVDEIYVYFYYGGGCVVFFFDVMQVDDCIIFVNFFFKNWLMIGWCVGWVVVLEELGQVVENFIQYLIFGVV